MSSRRREPRWVTSVMARATHADQIRQHGGSPELRDKGLLESALERARNRWLYDEKAKRTHLAACYGVGKAKNHAFVDGNKRTAFQVMYLFLGLNGLQIVAEEPEVVAVMLAVASSELDEEGLVRWLAEHTQPR